MKVDGDKAMKKILAFGLLFLALLFTGCISVPRASESADAEAKQFIPIKDKSVFYVYRNEYFGGTIGMDVYFNSADLGGTTANHFLRIVASPGSHIIASKAENRDSITIKSEPGKIYYVWQEAKMGVLTARTKLSLVSEAEGQSGVRECRLVDHLQPE